MLMGYLMLSASIALEIIAMQFLKASDGFKNIKPGLVFIGCMMLCFFIFSKALLLIPLGIAYAIWGGVGAAATAAVAHFLFKEPLTRGMMLGITFIVGGVALLNARAIIG